MKLFNSFVSICFTLTVTAVAACDPAAEGATLDTSQVDSEWMQEHEHGNMRVLAGFEFDGGARAIFAIDDETGDYGYIEYGDDRTSSPYFKSGADLTTLEKYLEIAPKDAPVPIELVELEQDDEAWVRVEGRVLVDGSIPDSMVVPHTQSRFRSAGYYCHSTLGQTRFENERCFSSGGNNKVEYCDSGKWSNLIRQQTRQRIFTTTAACARDNLEPWQTPTDGRIRHLQWMEAFSVWAVDYAYDNIAVGTWWWVDWGSYAMPRRANHTTNPNDNYTYVRGYSVFYNTY